MRPSLYAVLVFLLLAACAATQAKNDWLSTAPQYSQDSGTGNVPSVLADVGGNGHNNDHGGFGGHGHR